MYRLVVPDRFGSARYVHEWADMARLLDSMGYPTDTPRAAQAALCDAGIVLEPLGDEASEIVRRARAQRALGAEHRAERWLALVEGDG